MSQERMNELAERLARDTHLTTALEDDPFATLRSEGFGDIAAAAERDRDRIGELVDRIYRDDEFRSRVEQDPIGELTGWGLPEVAIQPVLVLAGAPDDVLERATADVEAHLSGKQVAAMAAIFGTLAFAQQATAAVQPAQSQVQVTEQAMPQVSQQAMPQVSQQVQPQVTAQVSNPARAQAQVSKPAQAKAQVAHPARASWQGIQPDRAKMQGIALLRYTTIGR